MLLSSKEGCDILGAMSNKVKRVFVSTYTNEGLKIGLMLGPLKFERSKRGGDYTSRKIPVATI